MTMIVSGREITNILIDSNDILGDSEAARIRFANEYQKHLDKEQTSQSAIQMSDLTLYKRMRTETDGIPLKPESEKLLDLLIETDLPVYIVGNRPSHQDLSGQVDLAKLAKTKILSLAAISSQEHLGMDNPYLTLAGRVGLSLESCLVIASGEGRSLELLENVSSEPTIYFLDKKHHVEIEDKNLGVSRFDSIEDLTAAFEDSLREQ